MRLRLKEIPETDLAYTAGLLDGEGCITLEAPGVSSTGVQKAGRVRILVYMSTPDVLAWLKETFGGCFYERKTTRAPTRKPVHHWGLSGQSAAILLERLEPYFRVKQSQARVAIEFSRHQQTRPAGNRLDPEYVAVLVGLKAEMLVLNRRGVVS